MKNRDPFFDNMKFILILLVVIGHFLEPLVNENIISRTVYLTIYTFHMPAFVLISGYFTKVDKSVFKINSVVKYIIPYLIFQSLFLVFANVILPNQYSLGIKSLLVPVYIYWYLPALFAWNLSLPIFNKIGKKYALVISLIIGLISGYFSFVDARLSLSRILVFLPFFLLGYFLDKDDFNKLRGLINKKVSILLFAMLGIFFWSIGSLFDYRWLWGYFPYSSLGATEWYAGINRLSIYILSILMIVIFISLVPNQQSKISVLGTRTLTVYLLHGFIVKLFFVLIPIGYFNNSIGVVLLIIAGILTTFLLSSEIFTKVLNPLLSPKFTKVSLKEHKKM